MPLAATQRIKIPDGKTNLVIFSGLLKTEALKQRAAFRMEGKEKPGLLFHMDFYDSKGKHLGSAQWNDGIDTLIPEDSDWKIYQFFSPLPSGTTDVLLQCGIKANSTGTVYIDNLDLKFF